ncbi:Methyltransferase type 11 [Akanthomyces lecanii RCEF 1005]|uniref:Methyltransferase type 11 n=1 Tax=Akanthomyces lecanii RCEF 1005 TaxID=1081108 RepID=A0A167PYK8_CORDF|nr:Methyltransferase type 11 [Akanthomyces lecanii RCEF 1005]
MDDLPLATSASGGGAASSTKSATESVAESVAESGTTVSDPGLAGEEQSEIEPASDGGSETDSALGVEQDRLAPVEKDANIQRILDLGTGTGIWAMDIGDEFPEAEVIGVDLSPIQPSYVPPNVRFIIDDVEDEWDYPSQLDFVFGRMLVGSISNWPKLMAQSYDNLRSGGWLELQDIVLQPQCADGTLKEDSFIKKWADEMLTATANINRYADSGLFYKQQMIDAGFVNVTEVVYKWPTNTWPKNEPYRELGFWSFQNIAGELEGLSLALFTRSLGWSADSVMIFLTEVRKAMADKSVHVWWPM